MLNRINVLFERLTGRDKVIGAQRWTLRCDVRDVCQLVQHGDNTAAEFLDFGERVSLAAAIDDKKRLAVPSVDDVWRKMPRTDNAEPRQLGNESVAFLGTSWTSDGPKTLDDSDGRDPLASQPESPTIATNTISALTYIKRALFCS